jgi:hypothetical protein
MINQFYITRLVKLVDTTDLKSVAFWLIGSSPIASKIFFKEKEKINVKKV